MICFSHFFYHVLPNALVTNGSGRCSLFFSSPDSWDVRVGSGIMREITLPVDGLQRLDFYIMKGS